MRYYKRTDADKILSDNRCFFDAENGQINLALERIKDLQEEFPVNSQTIYAEALIRKDYLGQGILAKMLFQKASFIDQHALAACNAASFVQDEAEFEKWADISLQVAKDDIPYQEQISSLRKDIGNGLSIWKYNIYRANEDFDLKKYGDSAAFAELALAKSEMSPQEEAEIRLIRAKALRALDEEAQHRRENLGESFLPEERLALQEALIELDRAIEIDEFNPILWNLKSAWCCLMGKNEEAITYANRAIELRPYNYPFPYYNKARALRDLKRYEEGMESATESLNQSTSHEFATFATEAQNLIDNFSKSRSITDFDDITPFIIKILEGATNVSQQELSQHQIRVNNFSLDSIAFNMKRRIRHPTRESACEYIPIMAELLTYFTPETVFKATLKIGVEGNTLLHENYLFAGLYLVAKGEGVLSKDAARFVGLTILGAVQLPEIRKYYRSLVLEPSAADTNELSQFDHKILQEFNRINRELPKLISDQETVDEYGKHRAANVLLSKYAFVESEPLNPEGYWQMDGAEPSKYAFVESEPLNTMDAITNLLLIIVILLFIIKFAMKILGV